MAKERDSVTVLNNAEVENLLDMRTCLEAMEEAYRDLGLNHAINRPRSHTYFPTQSKKWPGFNYRFKSQEGGIEKFGVWALRITSDMAGFAMLPGGIKRRKLMPAAAGNRYVGLIFLFDMETTELLAVIQDSFIQKMRVGATSGVGVKCLAREDSHVVGLFGSGWQAGAHLEAICLLRDTKEVRVYSPTPEHRRQFADEMGKKLSINIRAVDRPEEAVRGCDIVMAATATVDAVFDGNLLERGMHVGCIVASDKTQKRRELDDAGVAKCDVVIVTSREQAVYDEQPDIYGAVQKGILTWDRIGELSELVSGKVSGRQNGSQITLFNNNVGMGIQFAAIGAKVLELAEKSGVGRKIPLDWFLEETSP
ncbi:MAG: ornithine cyclodeaminase family protein [Deltaproteobacteria bacterium]|nr:ornithine cyclodeaminase family protein [Deltaproteobacteria bacterium]